MNIRKRRNSNTPVAECEAIHFAIYVDVGVVCRPMLGHAYMKGKKMDKWYHVNIGRGWSYTTTEGKDRKKATGRGAHLGGRRVIPFERVQQLRIWHELGGMSAAECQLQACVFGWEYITSNNMRYILGYITRVHA